MPDRIPAFFAPPSPAYPSRREFLRRAGNGFGMIALAGLLQQQGLLASSSYRNPLAPRPGHFPAKAKAVIWLFMNGGPSQVDTWDYKPELAKVDGKDLPGFDKHTGFFADQVGPLMKSPFKFQRHGQSGAWVSELFPHMARHVDKMAFIYSCWTDSNNHSPALFKINTGMSRMGFPCLGSWVTYGLGTESQNLPAFVVMYDTLGRGIPKGHSQNWGAGFLPSIYQGTALKPQGQPIEDLIRPAEMSPGQQRAQLDLLNQLNRRHAEQNPAEADLTARIESFELAYRMQMAAPEALDVDREPQLVQRLYGLDNPKCAHFARQCLIARRLVERGVRFVQIYSGGMENQLSWDGHIDIQGNHRGFAQETDQPIAALLEDLETRGLLDSTLVIWGGEFGRLPVSQKGEKPGRDHNPHAFTVWLAGGGVKGGVQHGATDEIGFKAAVDRVSVHDLHATILHLLGLDHKRLTYRYNGRDFRLTDVHGNVVTSILA
ncbi:MAG: DUF1501 domain-containing protein [Gemmatales bacterium]|nr:DUF1501 domain-containing protein [Gemmatales bacterium]MDW8385434.1 DUF1501 domain-containing protein [Gemmatales bacterium]